MLSSPALNSYIDFALGHLPLTLLVVGLVFALLALAILRKPHSGRRIVEVLFRSYLFWTIAVLYGYIAVVQGALGPSATAAVHAQAVMVVPETAYANLAFAVLAIVAFVFGSLGLRFAAVVGPAIYALAPIALAEPATLDTLYAHAPQAAIYLLGIFYFILQLGAGRAPVSRRADLFAQ